MAERPRKKKARRSPPAPQNASYPTRLLDEEHLAVRRERPQLDRHDRLELIAGFTQRRHRRDDRVPEMPGVLERVAVSCLIERLLQLVGAALELVGQLRQAVEELLALDRLAARRLPRRTRGSD